VKPNNVSVSGTVTSCPYSSISFTYLGSEVCDECGHSVLFLKFDVNQFPGCASRAQKNSSVSVVSSVPKQVSVRYGIIITRDDNRATGAQLFASSPQTPFATSAPSLLEAVAGGL
jgi:hypothetical protein